MANLHIYTRDDQGLVTYQGPEDWGSREQLIEHYYLPRRPEYERLMGWPHSRVAWHGTVGFGEDA